MNTASKDRTNSVTINDDDDVDTKCFLYEIGTKPTAIEKIFGEPYHVKDEYGEHQISIPFVFTLISVYVVEGCLSWILIAARYYGVAIWNIGPAEMQHFRTIVVIPWTVKIIYGLIIDSFPLFGYKRKSYMIMFGILAPISLLIAILYGYIYNVHLICMTLSQLSVAFCDVIADALTVERTEFKSHSVAARLQALAWGSRSISAIIGLLISTRMQVSGQPRDFIKVYWIYFGVSLLMPICGMFLPETRLKKLKNDNKIINGDDECDSDHQDDDDHNINYNTITTSYSIKKILYLAFETLCRKSIFYPLLFVFVLNCTPITAEALDFYFIYNLGFDSIQIGYLAVIAYIAFLLAIIIITIQSRTSNDTFSLKKMFLIWTLIATILPFVTLILVFRLNTKIGFPDFPFMIGDTIIIATSSNMLMMGYLILFARICPPGIEGFFMTVLTSISNISSIISLQISSVIINALNIKCIEDIENTNNVNCNFENLWILIIIVNLTTLIPLIFINKIPNEQQLQIIGQHLKDKIVNTKDMIIAFSLCNDYVFPFFKRNICCCLCCNNHHEKQMGKIKKRNKDKIKKRNNDNINEITMLHHDQCEYIKNI